MAVNEASILGRTEPDAMRMPRWRSPSRSVRMKKSWFNQAYRLFEEFDGQTQGLRNQIKINRSIWELADAAQTDPDR